MEAGARRRTARNLVHLSDSCCPGRLASLLRPFSRHLSHFSTYFPLSLVCLNTRLWGPRLIQHALTRHERGLLTWFDGVWQAIDQRNEAERKGECSAGESFVCSARPANWPPRSTNSPRRQIICRPQPCCQASNSPRKWSTVCCRRRRRPQRPIFLEPPEPYSRG